MAMLVIQIAAAVAAFTWMLVEWAMRGKPTVVGICSGAVAGLVAITPASGFVDPIGAFAIGIGAGVFCYWGCTGLKRMFGYDDALDCFGVHAIGGIVGALLTGVFAVEQYGGRLRLVVPPLLRLQPLGVGLGVALLPLGKHLGDFHFELEIVIRVGR